MQISCVTREILLDVYEYHEKYPNLVVRVAGYSEYFINLSDEKKSCDNKKYSKFNELKGRMSASRRNVTSHGAYSPYMDLVNIIGHDGNIS